MNLDVDYLIAFFEKFSEKQSESSLDEQDYPTPPSSQTSSSPSDSGSGSGGKTPRKWESGASRGKSNPTANTVWTSGRKLGKTYMNDPKHVWNTGLTRGKSNSLYYD